MNKRNAILSVALSAAVISLAILVVVGCSSKSVLEQTSQSATVTVSASPNSIVTGSTSVIEATVTSGGNGLANQAVVFTVSPTSAGYFTPSVDTTDGSGVAAAVFSATNTGSVTISAAVYGTSASSSAALTVTETQQSGSGNVQISVSPTLLLANGSDTSVVIVTVQDGNYQPAPDSTLVKFTSGEKFEDVDGNGYWSPGIDSLIYDANANGQWDGIGLIPSTSLISGGAGQAVVNYIAGSDALTVYIKATVDDNGIQGAAEQSVQLSPDAAINSIYLASDSINLVVRQTGGIESALLYAIGYDINANPVPEGLTINFIITDGPGGGEHLGTVGYGPYAAITNSQGIATVTIHSGDISGTIRVRAYADTVLSNATQVMVSAGPPAQIVVGSEFCNVDYWDDVGEKVIVTAVISDVYMTRVNDSTVVYFTTDEGTMKSHEERTRDLEGIAKTLWISGTNVGTADGRVLVIAETAGGTVADTGMFYNSHVPDTLIVSGIPASMPANGISKAVVYVTGLDLNGNPVIDGTAFKADATYLNVEAGTLTDGCYTSSDRVKITSTILLTDESTPGGNDDGIGAYDVIYYWSGSAISTYNVTLTTDYAYRGNCLINGLASVMPGDVVYYSVSIKDRYGCPLGDHTLVMTASAGTVSGATQDTDSYGEAEGFVWTAPATPLTYTLTVTDTDPRGGIVLSKSVTVQEP
ncbi:MAG: hypothetical protein ABII79_04240 [bacterium]